MSPIDIATLAATSAGWAGLGIQWFRNRSKNTADYANAAFSAWEALAARQEQRERELLAEVTKLRHEVGLLRRTLVKHGITVPEGEVA